MDINRARLSLAYIFTENKKLSKSGKIQLIRFIESADEHQLKVLMMDGEILPSKTLDKHTRTIIDDRFNASGINPYKASVEALIKAMEFIKK